jgi:exodeoxyribonuclease-1
MISSGAVFNHADKSAMSQIRNTSAEGLSELNPNFDDPRLPEMLFRYRARNFPETLNDKENQQWQTYCRNKLLSGQEAADVIGVVEYRSLLEEMKTRPDVNIAVLNALEEYAKGKMNEFAITEEDFK